MCIGVVSGGRYTMPGEGSHFVPTSMIGYFNVYAGPFCPYHELYFQVQAIQDHDESFPEHAGFYEDGRLDAIDKMQHMVAVDVRGVLA